MHEAECEGSARDLAGRKRHGNLFQCCGSTVRDWVQRDRSACGQQQTSSKTSSETSSETGNETSAKPAAHQQQNQSSKTTATIAQRQLHHTNMRYFTQLCGEAVWSGLPMIGRLVFPCLDAPNTFCLKILLGLCEARPC